ncbi:MAG: DUF1559 domain-containing protein [Planctomycetes bacterium]|nr:DUF1559 domain-containing protein [Planctomycetota bacterium]
MLRSRARRAFTLIELLITIAVIAMLAALLLPAATMVRAAGRTAACGNNLRQIATAMLAYAGDHDDWFPPLRLNATSGPLGYDGGDYWTNLLDEGGYLDYPWEPGHQPGGRVVAGVYRCRTMADGLLWSSGGYGMVESPWWNADHRFPSTREGRSMSAALVPSSTVIIGDAEYTPTSAWAQRAALSIQCPVCAPWSWDGMRCAPRHRGRANVACVDAHVEARRVDDLEADVAIWGHQ